MNNTELKQWLQCDDEMKMDSFFESFHDAAALRKFAILNAESVTDLLVDDRCRNAVVVANAFVNKEVSEKELEQAYYEAESAFDEIMAAFTSEDDPTEAEERTENAALVALWAALPVGHTGVSPLESARESALHTAYYCFQLDGFQALKDQLKRFEQAGMTE